MEDTGIEWADHTFNPWMGCTRVSPACDHCYAAVWGKRFGVEWGSGAPRRLAKSWAAPKRWHRRAVAQERPERVFCASLADVFDAEVPDDWRGQLTTLINATPMLDWLLLTKRPVVMCQWWQAHSNMAMLNHVACGVTIENVASLRARAPILEQGWPGRRFWSMEPLLECIPRARLEPYAKSVDWIIVGGESGPHARPMELEWARIIRDFAQANRIPFFMKQLSEHGGQDKRAIPADLAIKEFMPPLAVPARMTMARQIIGAARR